MIKIDIDGKWEVHSGYKLLIVPSQKYKDKQKVWNEQAEIAQAERDAVQVKRDACIKDLKKEKVKDLRDKEKIKNKHKGKHKELDMELSIEDIAEMVANNIEAEVYEAEIELAKAKKGVNGGTL